MEQPNHNEALGLARTSLSCYAQMMFPSFELAKHHALLSQKLEDVEAGRCKRLMVFMPPRHGKSLLSTQIFPAWFLGRNPQKSVITATYGQDLADDFGRVVRGYVNDSLTRATFPELKIAEDSNSMKRFTTSAGGAYYAVGRGAAITGRGCSVLLLDDPLKDADEARSENVRHSLHEWYSSVAYTRLQPDGAIVLIQTRWHHDDLAGWLLREHADENWDVLILPAIAETDSADWRKEGEALWPEHFPLDTLKVIKVAVGGASWASLYQQRPSAAEGEVFRREWWQRYTELPTFSRILQSWDTAFKTGQQNDYSVCTTWGEAKHGYFLLDCWRGRVEFPELKRRVAASADEWRPHAILVEDKASGQSLIQELKQSTRFPVLAIKVDTDKISRAHAASPLVEAGKVFLPQSAPWLTDFLYEHSVFPVGAHDDMVDSTTQALNYMRGTNLCLGYTEFLKRLSTQQNPMESLKPAKILPPAAPDGCPVCQTTAPLQRIPGGRQRCYQCGWQPPPPLLEALANQIRT